MVDDLEYAFVRVLEVCVFWGDQLLKVHHLSEGTFALGSGTELPIPGTERFDVARMSSRGPEFFDPIRATWTPLGTDGARLTLGDFTVVLALTQEGKRPPRERGALLERGKYLGIALVLHAFVLSLLAHLDPAFGNLEESLRAERVVTMQRLLAVADAYELEPHQEKRPVAELVPPTPLPVWSDWRAHLWSESVEEPESQPVLLRVGAAPVVRGGLPPEVVQRIVRQNFGRFRRCYEAGLRRSWTLQGRIAVRFVIDRSGAVSSAKNAGSSLADPAMVSCVVHEFAAMSFPMSENGPVTVRFPIDFAPAS